jgi:hypothetical protein
VASDKARAILHDAYMQGYRDGQAALLEGGSQTPRRRIVKVLMDELLTGPKPAEWCLTLAARNGVSQRTLMSAKADAGVVSVKQRDRWVWVHPEQVSSNTYARKDAKDERFPALFADSPITPYTDGCAAA